MTCEEGLANETIKTSLENEVKEFFEEKGARVENVTARCSNETSSLNNENNPFLNRFIFKSTSFIGVAFEVDLADNTTLQEVNQLGTNIGSAITNNETIIDTFSGTITNLEILSESPTPAPTVADESSDDGLGMGAIIGIAAGSVALVLVVGGILFCRTNNKAVMYSRVNGIQRRRFGEREPLVLHGEF